MRFHIVKDWLNKTLRRKLAVAAMALTVGLVVVTGALSYSVALNITQHSIQHTLQHEGSLAAQSLEIALSVIVRDALRLTHNSQIINALLDSYERETYLVPFFQDLELSYPTAFSVALVDHRGVILAMRGVTDTRAYQGAAWLKHTMETGTTFVEVVQINSRPFLRISLPLLSPATSKTEGALVLEVYLMSLFSTLRHDTARTIPEQWRFDGNVVAQTNGWNNQNNSMLLKRSALTLPAPLQQIRAEIEVGELRSTAQAPLRKLIWSFIVIGSGVVGLSIAGAIIISRRITNPLATLADVAGNIHVQGSGCVDIPSASTDEIVRLTHAINNMILRLQQGRKSLQNEVIARTQELDKSESRLRTVLNNVIDGIITIDELGNITSFNPAAESIFGYRSDEVIGKNVRLLMPPPFKDEHDGYLARYRADGTPRIMRARREVTGLRRDGTTFPLELAVSESFSGSERFFTGIVRDDTLRKASAEALRQSEERFRLMANHSSDIIARVSGSGAIDYVSPAVETILGYPAEHFIKMNIFTGIHADDVETVRAGFSAATDKFLIQTIVYRQLAADKQYVWLETSLRRLHEVTDRADANIIAVMRDVSERVRVTSDLDHFKRILDNTLDLILMFDPEKLLLVYVNGGALSMLRYKREDLHGETVGNILSSMSLEEFLQRLQPLRQSKDTVFHMDLELRRCDGTMLSVEASCQFVPTGDEPGVYVVIARDISERVKIDRMKNDFISVVSHELRTPLTSIHGALKLIASGTMGTLSDTGTQLVDVADRNCNRLGILINDILDMEKIASGNMRFNIERVQLKPLLDQALEFNRAYGEEYRVTFKRTAGPNCWVDIDTDRFFQVMANLLSNAAKFSLPHGTIDISVAIHEASVVIGVRDYGRGIPEDFRDKVFHKFSQADSTTTRKKGGTGLGLAITKAIVEQLGGVIGFESEKDRGTLFYFILPCVPITDQSEPQGAQVHITDIVS